MKVPHIKVPVLYPLGYKPGESEGWRETADECFALAMSHLHDKIIDAGYTPDQGKVVGPGPH